MRKNRVWVIEYYSDVDGRWKTSHRPTYHTKADALKYCRDYFIGKNIFRVRKYEPSDNGKGE
jgi:hypothetical protein